MITAAIYLIYAIIILIFITSAAFIVFHLVRYSYNKKTELLTLLIFLSVFAALLISNVILFLSIKFGNLIKL